MVSPKEDDENLEALEVKTVIMGYATNFNSATRRTNTLSPLCDSTAPLKGQNFELLAESQEVLIDKYNGAMQHVENGHDVHLCIRV